jgi:hypothetical protein
MADYVALMQTVIVEHEAKTMLAQADAYRELSSNPYDDATVGEPGDPSGDGPSRPAPQQRPPPSQTGDVTLASMLSEETTSPTTPKETPPYGKTDLPTRTPGSKRQGAQSVDIDIAPRARCSQSVSPTNRAHDLPRICAAVTVSDSARQTAANGCSAKPQVRHQKWQPLARRD